MIARLFVPVLVAAAALALALPVARADAACPIPTARQDDDYCDDLKAGCDEPHTSACSFIKRTPTFQCKASVTGEPQLLPASRVGDTVCDCCDGSDEAAGGCPNTCEALQEKYLDDAFKWFEDVMLGKERRDAAVVEARGIVAGWEAELKAAEAGRAKHQVLLAKLQALKAKEEKVEGWENFLRLREEAKRKGEVLALEQTQPQEQQEEGKSEEEGKGEKEAGAAATDEHSTRDDEEAVDASVDTPSDAAAAAAAPLPSSLKPVRTVTVDMTDEAGQGENAIAHLLRATTATDGTRVMTLQAYLDGTASSSSSSSSPAPPKSATSVWEPTDILELNLQALGALILGPFQALYWAVNICKDELMDALASSSSKKKKARTWNKNVPATTTTTTAATPAFEAEEGWSGVLQWVVNTIARGPATALALLRPETIPNAPERLEAALLRFAVEQVEDEVGREERRVEELREAMDSSMYSAVDGDERVFLTWRGKCIDKQDKEHEYTICPFNEVKQNHLLVGKWAGWIEREDGLGSKEGAGPVMYFTEGQQCWNGPKRSAVVQLFCGPEEEVVEVTEPSVCLYDFVMTTPLVCDAAVVAEAEEKLKKLGVTLPGEDEWEEVDGASRIEREEL